MSADEPPVAPATAARPGALRTPAVVALTVFFVLAAVTWATGAVALPGGDRPADDGALVVDPERPVIFGSLPSDRTRVDLVLQPGGVRWTVAADEAGGLFETTVPAVLTPGDYDLFMGETRFAVLRVPVVDARPATPIADR